MRRNAYIEHTIWNTVHDPAQHYAGGEFPMQSDGSDTLAEWVKADRPLPHNFFTQNPALTIRAPN